MRMYDKAHFDDASIIETRDGYLTAFARIARTGIQEYAGYEVGKPDVPVVRVYRPENEVFNADSMHSMAHRPVTLNHPKDAVTAENWKEHARGQTGSEVVRDGEFIRVPLVLMDSTIIKSVKDKKTLELSVGYDCELKFAKGLTTDGQEYDAIQTQIRGNHLAVVPAARGGPALRIGDDHDTQRSKLMEKELRTITVDGIEVQVVGDVSAKVISRHLEAMKTKIEGLQSQLTEEADAHKKSKDSAIADAGKAKTEIETRDGKITALEKQVKDSEMTPAKLDEMVKDRAMVVDKARKIAPNITVDGRSLADIRKDVVTIKLGDEAVKGMSDAAIDGAFSAITAGAATTSNNVRHTAVALGDSHRVEDTREKAYDENASRLEGAWKTPSKAA